MPGISLFTYHDEEGRITRDNFIHELKKEFPEFVISDEELLYIIGADFSLFLLTKYNEDNEDDLQKGLKFIEKLLVTGDDYIKELSVIGILEGIQNIGSHSKTNFKNFERLLGLESKKAWDELNDFWDKLPIIPN